MTTDRISTAMRQAVRERFGERCAYCLIPEQITLIPHEIDHVIARKHGGLTALNNLALCCALCNKYKGSDIASVDPASGEIVRLYHPLFDRWHDHFEIESGRIIPRTSIGRVTTRLLHLNRSETVSERRFLQSIGVLDIPDNEMMEPNE